MFLAITDKTARTWWKLGRFGYSSLSVMMSSLETVRGWNTTFPVSVLMKYISFSNSFLSKLMEPFIIITNTFLYFLWHILFRRSLCCFLQHRPAFHIRSVQMSTERKMCCMEFLLVTICTAPFLWGYIYYNLYFTACPILMIDWKL